MDGSTTDYTPSPTPSHAFHAMKTPPPISARDHDARRIVLARKRARSNAERLTLLSAKMAAFGRELAGE